MALGAEGRAGRHGVGLVCSFELEEEIHDPSLRGCV
jgi:hypothetical protein